MLRLSFHQISSLLLLLLNATSVLAIFDELYFSSTSTCPDYPFTCIPGDGQACALDSLVQKNYCCGSESTATCWTGSTECSGSRGGPSSSQTQCNVGGSKWCCLKDTEICTQTTNQTNVCWATQPDPLANLSLTELKKVYASLSSASPTASTWSIDPAQLAVASTSASTTATRTSSSTSRSSSSSTASGSGKSSKASTPGLSTGAIAGIAVGGAVLLIALIAGIIFCLRRRRKQSKSWSQGGADAGQMSPLAHAGHEQTYSDMQDAHGNTWSYYHKSPVASPASELPSDGLVELPARNKPAELHNGNAFDPRKSQDKFASVQD